MRAAPRVQSESPGVAGKPGEGFSEFSFKTAARRGGEALHLKQYARRIEQIVPVPAVHGDPVPGSGHRPGAGPAHKPVLRFRRGVIRPGWSRIVAGALPEQEMARRVHGFSGGCSSSQVIAEHVGEAARTQPAGVVLTHT